MPRRKYQTAEEVRQARRAAHSRWERTNRDKVNAGRRQRYHGVSHEKTEASRRRATERLRGIIFRRYGEMCACCDTTERLTIDHIGAGGLRHRKEIGRTGGAGAFYRWLMFMYLPPGYQTLCMLCNQTKGQGERCYLDHSVGALSYKEQHRLHKNSKSREAYARQRQDVKDGN